MLSRERPVRDDPAEHDDGRTARAIWWAIAIALVVAAVYLVHDAMLLLFAGILLAVFLRALARRLVQWTGMADSLALAIVVAGIVAIGATGIWLAAPQVADQARALMEAAPRSWEAAKDRIIDQLPDEGPLAEAPERLAETDNSRIFQLMGSGFGAITGALGAVGSGLVMLVLGVYLAADPEQYRRGLIRLLPLRERPHGVQVLDLIGDKLEGWILGTLISAAIVGSMTGLGLWLLGIEMALILALIAAALTFVPNIGPLLALFPAVLIALGSGTTTTVLVIALYMVVQAIESYLITPVIQQRTVDLPPVTILMAQIVMALLFGLLGVAIAMPLTAMALVLVQELWIKDKVERSDLAT